MTKQISELKETLKEKQAQLDKAKQTLKTEFIGIDSVSDKIFEWIGPWYLFPEMQEEPLVINLWGMTGVGKSSLVNRLVELLEFNDCHYRFDMGELSNESNMNVKDQLRDLSIKAKPEPLVISFDEFQHARTINEEGREVQKAENRIIWKVLDSGKFDMDLVNTFDIRKLSKLTSKIESSVEMGVKAKNGIVIEKPKLHYHNYHYVDWIEADSEEKSEFGKKLQQQQEIPLVEESDYSFIYSCAPELFENRYSVVAKFKSMDENETLQFLTKCLEVLMKPTTIDCSLSLIFIIGNLDEAYKMTKDFTPELSADEFHRLSKRINITTIKNALKKRFRSEQIARLGNNHIIYPAFNCASYREIIQKELSRISHKSFTTNGVSLSFNDSVVDLIYNEGVYPTQGTRPVYSTIHQIINSKLAEVFSSIALQEAEPDELEFSYENGKMIIQCFQDGHFLERFQMDQHLELGKLQQNRKDDMQAITAVHESGHAVLSILLMKSLPKVIYSVLSDTHQQGFIYSTYQWEYIARKEILPRVAVMLGGYASEIIVFGKDNLTTGANTDIERATDFLSDMYKQHGMGKTPVFYSVSQLREEAYHNVKDVESAIYTTIEEALNLAFETLQEEQSFLLALSDYLADHRMIQKSGVKKIYQETASKKIDLIEKGDLLFYREHLKKQVENIEGSINNVSNMAVSLNKWKD